MTDPRTFSIKDFTYSLPEERIARYPLPERDASKLLIYKKGIIREDVYKNIDLHLPEESLLLFNDSKVVEARLLFQKSTGGVIEIFCLEPHHKYADITSAMMQRQNVVWKCLVGGASKWKPGQVLKKIFFYGENEFLLTAKYIEKSVENFTIELSWNIPSLSFAEILHHTGTVPLPPYIKRPAEKSDVIRYQTIYASNDGSVAAPTAGLHFTNTVFQKLDEKKIHRDWVTLHVGAGTFKPVKSELMNDHTMHAEFYYVTRSVIENILNHLPEKIIAVGTTSLRTMESLYWLGKKIITDKKLRTLDISQWEVYDSLPSVSATEALTSLLGWMDKNHLESLSAKTQLLIAPGFEFKIANGLITNFHQPQSTLLLLVAAFAGNNWQKIYDYALLKDFRFLSYGDGCLLWKSQD